jgi:Leucine-rich repeat (LRR) protein
LTGLNKLKSISFADNKIVKINKQLFVSKSITELSFARNKINSIAKKSFRKLPNLRILILSTNPIKKLSREYLGVVADTQLKFGLK